MSIWAGFKNLFSGGGLNNPDEGYQSSGPYSLGNGSAQVTDERAMAISAVFACIRLISQSGGTLPLGLYRRTSEGRVPLEDDHPLVHLLRYQPNKYMSAKQFRQAMLVCRAAWGNFYALKQYSGKRLVSLMPLKPALMDIDRRQGRLIYKYSTRNGIIEYSQDQIWHVKGFSADGVIGLSPLAYSRYSMGIAASADQKAASSFGSMPNLGLKMAGWPNQEQREQLRQLYQPGTDVTGEGNLWLFPGDIDPKVLGIPPNDLQMLESRQYSVSDIARFYGVPAVMIDGTAGATAAWPASYEQQVLAFMQFSLRPYLEEIEDSAAFSLMTRKERREIYIEHNVEGFLRADSQSRANYFSTMVQNGIMTRNEVRQKENLKPMDGGDELTIQLNLAPADKLLEGQDNVTRNA